LEIAGELPVGNSTAELTFLPLAARREVAHERCAEELLRRLGAGQSLGRVSEGAGQLSFGGELAVIGVAADWPIRLDAMFDAPESRADLDVRKVPLLNDCPGLRSGAHLFWQHAQGLAGS